jgi:hypothetical protein
VLSPAVPFLAGENGFSVRCGLLFLITRGIAPDYVRL